MLDGDLVSGHGLVIAVERGNQHDQGAFRQVEVGDQAVNGFQLDAGIDEDAGVAAARYDLAVLGPDGFQRAAARGAHGDDAVACSAGLVDEIGSLLADRVPLAVHLVVLNGFLVDRAERA